QFLIVYQPLLLFLK
ncbi:hypothetical protein, partial [Plasmodium yoelii yoelii]